jgi:mannitol/fructose-specific phosphotransferase system IIA component (Ntr-type)
MQNEIMPKDEPESNAVPNGAQAGPPPGSQGPETMQVILGLQSGSLSESVDELVPKALQGTKIFPKSAQIAKELRANLGYGAVELRPGLAFLHQRVDKLAAPRAAFGISREGLDPGVRLHEKIFLVVLFLKPARDFGFDIPLWARKTFCNEGTRRRLRAAQTEEAVLRILQST